MKLLKKSGIFLSLILAFTVLFSGMAQAAETSVNVDLVEISDTHGHIFTENDGVTDYKMAYLAKQFESLENGIILSGGDMFQGTAVSNLLQGKPIIKAMAEMKFDAMALGNHEYDWGVSKLVRKNASGDANLYYDNTDTGIPVLACNVFQKGTNKLANYVKEYTVVERAGKKIAIIGAVDNIDFPTSIMPSLIQDVDFRDPAPIINQLAKELLSGKKADAVIVLAHLGGQRDEKTIEITGNIVDFVKKLDNKAVSAVFGGHSHQIVTGKINSIPVCVPYKEARGYVKLRITFQPNGTVSVGNMEFNDITGPVHGAKDADLDPAVKKISDDAKAEVGPVLNEKIAVATVDMTRNAEYGHESLVGDWSTDATLEIAGTDFAVSNDGGLRCDILKGDVTVGTLYQFMPFDNVLVKVKMTGAQVKTMMEQSVMDGGKGLQIAGFTCKYDPNAPSMSRVFDLKTADGTPIDPAKTYTVATNEFVGTGGDGYTVFTEPSVAATYQDTHMVLRDALTAKTREQKVLSPVLDGRLSQGTKPAEVITVEFGSYTLPRLNAA